MKKRINLFISLIFLLALFPYLLSSSVTAVAEDSQPSKVIFYVH